MFYNWCKHLLIIYALFLWIAFGYKPCFIARRLYSNNSRFSFKDLYAKNRFLILRSVNQTPSVIFLQRRHLFFCCICSFIVVKIIHCLFITFRLYSPLYLLLFLFNSRSLKLYVLWTDPELFKIRYQLNFLCSIFLFTQAIFSVIEVPSHAWVL